jgi:hypothetical protein
MNNDTSEDGDFAAQLEQLARQASASDLPAATRSQSIEDVLVHGEEPSDEFIEEMRTLNSAPALSDEELERQALEHPGADGDPRTPE